MSAEVQPTSKTTVYDTDDDLTLSLGERVVSRFKALYHYRYLLQNLIVRDLKVRYKNSALGVLWSLLNPLFMAIVFSLVFRQAFGGDLRQYYVFFLVGIMPWNFFNAGVMSGTTSLLQNASLIKKVNFPRELLPTAAVLSNMVNFLFAFIILLIFLFASGLGLTIHALWVPFLLITQIIFILGLALFLGSINVFYRDVLMILDIVMLGWFFLTPVFYPFEQFDSMAPLVLFGMSFEPSQVMRWLNPMASIIDGYRTVLWGTIQDGVPSAGPVSMYPPYILRTFVTAVIVFVIGYATFLRTHRLFGEKL